MAINRGWKDTIDNIIFPNELATWDHLGNAAGDYFTATSIGGVSLTSTGGLNGGGGADFAVNNAGYWRIDYSDAQRLKDREEVTIDIFLRINSDSTETQFQLDQEGIIFASGENGALIDDGSSQTVDYALTVVSESDGNNYLKFYYQREGLGLKSLQLSQQLSVDTFHQIKIRYHRTKDSVNDSNLTIQLDGVDRLTANQADDELFNQTSLDNFVFGGNANGYNLKSATIDAFRMSRKDIVDASATGVVPSTESQLIEPRFDSAGLGWDQDTLMCFFFNEGAGNAPKARQLKRIPQTWADWTYWWINPESYMDVTTSQVTFSKPVKGFKKIFVNTTDGFVNPFGAGETYPDAGGTTQDDRTWRNSKTGYHRQTGDIDFVAPYWNVDYAEIQSFESTNVNLRIPSRGYLPEEQKTESQQLLDSTKVDSASGDASNNQGLRPRGIKQIDYKISEETITETLEHTADTNTREHIRIAGLPYWEYNEGSTRSQGGAWATAKVEDSGTGQVWPKDLDFRQGNANYQHVKSIDFDSTEATVITTYQAHGLSNGDKIHFRTGPFYAETIQAETSFYEVSGFLPINGHCFVNVIDSTSFELYADSALTNPVELSSNSQRANQTSGITNTRFPFAHFYTGDEPTYQDTGNSRITTFKMPFQSFKQKDSTITGSVLPLEATNRYTQNYSLNASGFDGNLYTGTRSAYSSEGALEETSNHTVEYTEQLPRGTVADPYITNMFYEAEASGYFNAGDFFSYALDCDFKESGTLNVQFSEVQSTGSAVLTNNKVSIYYNINGVRRPAYTDDAFTVLSDDTTDTITIPIQADSWHGADDLLSIQLSIAVGTWGSVGVGDTLSAKATVWFTPDSGSTDMVMFYAGGLQPNKTMRTPRQFSEFAGKKYPPILWRPRNIIQHANTTGTHTLEGIPPFGYAGTGMTVNTDGSFANALDNPAGGSSNVFNLGTVDENATATGVVAPWVQLATQTAGQHRIWEGFIYRCVITHTSSKNFWADYSEGYWDKIT